jgi:cytochrome c553
MPTYQTSGAAGPPFALTTVLLVLAVPMLAGRADTLEDKAALCGACHGENGVPQDRETPIIWGQKEGYLYLQLRDYKRGTRRNEQMAAVIETLERDELLALAALFSQRPWPDLRQQPASQGVAAQAVRANIAVGCTGCHLDHYQGDGTVPRLAGQSGAYLGRTMVEFRARTRGNNPGMSDLMNAASAADLAAMAKYLAGL